jgi:hypothetical protein
MRTCVRGTPKVRATSTTGATAEGAAHQHHGSLAIGQFRDDASALTLQRLKSVPVHTVLSPEWLGACLCALGADRGDKARPTPHAHSGQAWRLSGRTFPPAKMVKVAPVVSGSTKAASDSPSYFHYRRLAIRGFFLACLSRFTVVERHPDRTCGHHRRPAGVYSLPFLRLPSVPLNPARRLSSIRGGSGLEGIDDPLDVREGMLQARPRRRRRMPSTAFVPLAVNSGVVVLAIAGAVVLVVLLVTVSMRGRQKRGAKERGEARRADEGQQKRGARERGQARRADEAREARRERDRDTAPEGGEDRGPDR